MFMFFFKQVGAISTLNGKSLKLVDKFAYLSSNISSTEREMKTMEFYWQFKDYMEILSLW